MVALQQFLCISSEGKPSSVSCSIGVPSAIGCGGHAGVKKSTNCHVYMRRPRVRSCMVLRLFEAGEPVSSALQQQDSWFGGPVGDLKRLFESGVRGVTGKPAAFQRAVQSDFNEYYVRQFSHMMQAGKGVEDAYWGMVVKDIQDACDLLLEVYRDSNGEDGFVTVDAAPSLVRQTHGIAESAKWLHRVIRRPNVYIKIPTTGRGVDAIREGISCGMSVNADLIFTIPRYEAVVDSYLDGLEAVEDDDLSRISCMVSFYVNRLESEIDKLLEQIGTSEALSLRGKAADAHAALAFKIYRQKFSGPRWEALARRGARKPRLLWGSAGAKSPPPADTHSIWECPLICPETVLEASFDPLASTTMDASLEVAQRVCDKIEDLGIHYSDVGTLLETDGVESAQKCFNDLISSLVKLDLELLFGKKLMDVESCR